MTNPEIWKYDGWYCWGINEVTRWKNVLDDVLSRAYQKVKVFGLAIDVGANIGIASYLLSRNFGYVYAFEPDEKNRECYKKNAELHGFSHNVHLFPYACGEVNERIGLTGKAGISRHYIKGDDVTSVRLDDIFPAENPKIDLLKVDAEGMDYLVLKGAVGIIKRDRPVVIFEFKDGDGRHDRWNSLTDSEDLLKSLGAKLEWKNKVDQIWYF